MSSPSPENPYVHPSALFYDPKAVAQVNEKAQPLLDELWADNTRSLPHGIVSWLGEHTIAVSTPTLGEARLALAENLPKPPYKENAGRRVAAALEKIMEITAGEYKKLHDSDEMLLGLFTDVDEW